LPVLVRVTVRNAVSGQILAVSSAARLHVDAPAECINPRSRGCPGAAAPAPAAASTDAAAAANRQP
jgi:general secretion pathway protein J